MSGCFVLAVSPTVAASALTATRATTTGALGSGAVLALRAVTGIAHVTLTIATFVAVEVIEGLLATFGVGAGVTATRIVAIVNMAVEAAATVVPGASADEETAGEPVGAVVTIGSAVIRGVVVVPVGTGRLRSDVDGDLGRSYWCGAETCRGKSSDCKQFPEIHDVHLDLAD